MVTDPALPESFELAVQCGEVGVISLASRKVRKDTDEALALSGDGHGVAKTNVKAQLAFVQMVHGC